MLDTPEAAWLIDELERCISMSAALLSSTGCHACEANRATPRVDRKTCSGEAHVRMDENEIKLGIQHLRLLHLLLGPTALFFLQLGHGRLELTQLLSQRFKI